MNAQIRGRGHGIHHRLTMVATTVCGRHHSQAVVAVIGVVRPLLECCVFDTS